MAHPWILVAVHPSGGQSSKIAHRVVRRLRTAGANVDVEPVELAPAPQSFDFCDETGFAPSLVGLFAR